MANYKAKPLSRKKIQDVALSLRQMLSVSLEDSFPVVKFFEFILPSLGYELEICGISEMPKEYALTFPEKNLVKIREDVYVRAVDENPRDLFTLAHEIGHIIFHDNMSISFARSDEKIKVFEDPEWQANTFAAELLAPSCAIKGMLIEEIMNIYKCSRQVATIQLSKSF